MYHNEKSYVTDIQKMMITSHLPSSVTAIVT